MSPRDVTCSGLSQAPASGTTDTFDCFLKHSDLAPSAATGIFPLQTLHTPRTRAGARAPERGRGYDAREDDHLSSSSSSLPACLKYTICRQAGRRVTVSVRIAARAGRGVLWAWRVRTNAAMTWCWSSAQVSAQPAIGQHVLHQPRRIRSRHPRPRPLQRPTLYVSLDTATTRTQSLAPYFFRNFFVRYLRYFFDRATSAWVDWCQGTVAHALAAGTAQDPSGGCGRRRGLPRRARASPDVTVMWVLLEASLTLSPRLPVFLSTLILPRRYCVRRRAGVGAAPSARGGLGWPHGAGASRHTHVLQGHDLHDVVLHRGGAVDLEDLLLLLGGLDGGHVDRLRGGGGATGYGTPPPQREGVSLGDVETPREGKEGRLKLRPRGAKPPSGGDGDAIEGGRRDGLAAAPGAQGGPAAARPENMIQAATDGNNGAGGPPRLRYENAGVANERWQASTCFGGRGNTFEEKDRGVGARSQVASRRVRSRQKTGYGWHCYWAQFDWRPRGQAHRWTGTRGAWRRRPFMALHVPSDPPRVACHRPMRPATFTYVRNDSMQGAEGGIPNIFFRATSWRALHGHPRYLERGEPCGVSQADPLTWAEAAQDTEEWWALRRVSRRMGTTRVLLNAAPGAQRSPLPRAGCRDGQHPLCCAGSAGASRREGSRRASHPRRPRAGRGPGQTRAPV